MHRSFQQIWQRGWPLIVALLLCTTALTTAAVLSSPLRVKIDGWSATTPLPQGLASRNAIVQGNTLYVVGGKNATDNPLGSVYAATIGSNGSLSSWTVAAQLPVPVYLHATVATNSHLYVIGGWDGSRTRAEIWRAPFASVGLGAFQKISDYPLALDLHKAVVVENRIYVLGGWTGSQPLDAIYYAEIRDNGLGPWVAGPALPKKLYRLAATAHNNTIYVTGGFDNQSAQSAVYRSGVRADGSLEGWQTTTQLPNALFYHENVIHDGRLLVLGGRGDAGEFNQVYSAEINADGSLGAWGTEPDLPESLYRFAAVSVNRNSSDYIYVLGGLHGANYRTNVYHSTYPNPPTPTHTPTATPSPTPSPTPLAAVNLRLQNHPQRWVAPGETITYTITYSNESAQAMNGVEIVSTVPPNVELIPGSLSAPPGVTFTYTGVQPGATIRWSVGDLAADATGQVSYQVYRPLPTPPVVPRALSISKSGPTSAVAGAPITYTIMVTNNTAFSITNLLVADTVPEGATLLGNSQSVGAENSVQWNIPSLPGDSVLVRHFTVTAAQTIVNSDYFVSSDEGPSAKGQTVIVTWINNTDPPPSGDGVAILQTGAVVTWRAGSETRSHRSNSAYNPTFELYMPLVRR